MRLAPQGCRDREGINPLARPPGPLIAASVEFTMVQPADRDREPIADFPPHRPLLGKLDVVGIRRGAAANKARLPRTARANRVALTEIEKLWAASRCDALFPMHPVTKCQKFSRASSNTVSRPLRDRRQSIVQASSVSSTPLFLNGPSITFDDCVPSSSWWTGIPCAISAARNSAAAAVP